MQRHLTSKKCNVCIPNEWSQQIVSHHLTEEDEWRVLMALMGQGQNLESEC